MEYKLNDSIIINNIFYNLIKYQHNTLYVFFKHSIELILSLLRCYDHQMASYDIKDI